MNFNVKLALWFTVASTIGRNVWAFVTLTVYLKDLTGSTVNVGVAEGIQGGLQAAAAIGAGLIADRWGRDIALKIGGIFGILSIAVTVFALLAPASWLEPSGNKTGFGEIAVVEWAGVEPLAEMTSENSGDMLQTSRYTAIAIALGLWGMYQGIWNVSAQQNGGVLATPSPPSKPSQNGGVLANPSPLDAIAVWPSSPNVFGVSGLEKN